MAWSIKKSRNYWIDIPDEVLPEGASGVQFQLELVPIDELFTIYADELRATEIARPVVREELEPVNPQNDGKAREVVARIDTVEIERDEELGNFRAAVEIARRFVTDWRGILDEDGEPIPFSKDVLDIAYSECRGLFNFVSQTLMGQAKDRKRKEVEEVAGDVRFRAGRDRVVDGPRGNGRAEPDGLSAVHIETPEPVGSTV